MSDERDPNGAADEIARLREALEEMRKNRDATSLQWAGEWKKQYETETRLREINAVMREALEIIAGNRQCLDNLMSNQDVARAAIARAEPQQT